MASFVLVHGAMHGGWCWRDVAASLRLDGHDVYTPTLTGQGERAHLRTASTGVHTHVEDLVGVCEFEDLHDVTLALHSYAGILAGPVAERLHHRVRRVVFLGAFVAQPGESLLDVEPPEVAERYRTLAAGTPSGDVIPASDAFLDQWGVTDPAARGWVAPRLTDFPLRCATDPVEFDPAALGATACAYVRHTAPAMVSLDRSWARARAAGWDLHEIACGHDMMVAAPDETAALLVRTGVGVVPGS